MLSSEFFCLLKLIAASLAWIAGSNLMFRGLELAILIDSSHFIIASL